MHKVISFFHWDRIYNYAGLVGGAILGLVGGWDSALQTLVILMALDYLSGVVVAIKERKLSSAVGFSGISKKLLTLVIVAVASVLDRYAGGGTVVCRTAAITFYVVNEAVSIFENAGRLGLPLPKALVSRLEQLKGETHPQEEKKESDE